MKKDNVMKKLFKYIGKYWILLILSIILAGISVVLQLYVPVLFGNAIDEIVAAHNVNFTQMWLYLKQILLFVVIAAAAIWIMNLVNNRMTYHIVQDIRSQAIRHIQKLPLSYLDQHSTGDIVSRIIADTDILSDGLLLGFTQLFSGVVTVVVTLIFMFSKNVWITLMVILLTPLSFLVAKFISSRSFTMFKKQSETRGKQTALIEEMIGNQKVVKAFGYEDKASKRFDEINKELKEYSQKAVFYSSLTNPSTRFVNNIIYAAVAQKSDGPPALGHRFSFCRLFCGQPGKRLPDIAGEVESPQRTHRAFAAQLHRAGDARRDVRRRLSLSAPDADVLCQRLSGHGAGRVGRDRDEPLCQRQQQCQHLVHILVGHDAEQEDELLPRESVPEALDGGPHPVGVVTAVQQKSGRMPQQLEPARPAHLLEAGLYRPDYIES